MVLKGNPLSGEERKIVSTRIYASEFVHFKKLCGGRAVNAKLREMIQAEIKRDINKTGKFMLTKKKEGVEKRSNLSIIRGTPLTSEIKLESLRDAL